MNPVRERNNRLPSSDYYPSEWIKAFMEDVSEKQQTYTFNVIMEFYLFHGIHQFMIDECLAYVAYLKRVQAYKQLSSKVVLKKINIITDYLTFLHSEGYSDMEPLLWKWQAVVKKLEKPQTKPVKKPSSKIKLDKKTMKKEDTLPEIIHDFLTYLERKGYKGQAYEKNIRKFYQFLEKEATDIQLFLEVNSEKLLFEKIRAYERALSERVITEKIATATASIYLRVVQLFVKFLCSKGLIDRNYSLPIHLRGRGTRANEYVPKESVIKLMDMIYENSNHSIRDLAMFLIIVDTGCRPIEVCNLTVDDYNSIERTLSFHCGKTPRRKVKISREVIDIINAYIEVRKRYKPRTESLFCDYRGFAISSGLINRNFYVWNIKAFDESRYPPKAFRHTYITNALEEYGFERVSKMIGHAEWRSTYYYLHRSKKRLLANTLDKSPLKENKGVFSSVDQNSNQR
ncbi:tyrosine-type recombinase/integrase [Paraliobacillus sp. X-1268]|uniref:tyrosine-type recombinase/integrase n=1 Tax=Paraliobacillus sp. X-1268 TaxID=2213193 RepID=UPI000E3D01F7|nr:tyrosine-type recombinase/integrase [Paraliobacillus sp. X-1268]